MTTYRGVLNADLDYRAPHTGFYGELVPFIHLEMYMTIYKFLTSEAAQGLGIVRRAYHSGALNTGFDIINIGYSPPGSSSLDYWDTVDTGSSPPGNNSWAVFEFTQADPPLWLMIQFASRVFPYPFFSGIDTRRFGSAPGSPARAPAFGQEDTFGSVAISAATRQNGLTPWNGSLNNNARDTQGTPIWNSGSIIFPRASADGGNYEDSANALVRILPNESEIFVYNASASLDASSGVYHVIASSDSFTLLTDMRGIGDYNVFFVGKYDPIRTAAEEGIEWVNYICLNTFNYNDSYKRVILPRDGDALSAYGPRVGGTQLFAGVNSTAAGGANNVFTNKVESCIIDADNLLSESREDAEGSIMLRHPNRAASDPTGRVAGKFDMFTIPVSCYGDHFGYGKLGEISAFRMVFGLPTNSTINNKQWAVFGNTHLNTIKIAVPWDGVTIPGTSGGRRGIPW